MTYGEALVEAQAVESDDKKCFNDLPSQQQHRDAISEEDGLCVQCCSWCMPFCWWVCRYRPHRWAFLVSFFAARGLCSMFFVSRMPLFCVDDAAAGTYCTGGASVVFGSFSTGIFLPTSDIDLAITGCGASTRLHTRPHASTRLHTPPQASTSLQKP